MSQTEKLQELVRHIDSLFDSMAAQQRQKAFRTAQRVRPNITEDDMMDPHSIPEIAGNPAYAYEDGLFNGIVAARIAIMRDAVEFVREEMEKEGET